MKTLNMYAVLFLSIFTINFAFAQKSTVLNHKENIKVSGNCGTCKNRIEKAALSAWVTQPYWDDQTNILVVSYDGARTSSEKIQKAIAAVGHDTQDFKGDDKAYSKLPSCCKYERNTTFATNTSSKSKMDCNDMSCCKNKTCCDKEGKCEDACKDMPECKTMICCKS